MILSSFVDIRINSSNNNRYKSKGKVGDVISITPFELSDGSHIKIDVQCDLCYKKSNIKWNSYVKNYQNGDWLCRSCKKKKNLNIKYGVDNVFQLESVKEKIVNTNIEKYGVSNPSKLESIKIKKEETNIKKYGKSHFMKVDSNKKYGSDNINSSDSIKEKKRLNWIDKTDEDKMEILEKRKETNIEKYGSESTFSVFSDKIKETNISKYGYINPSSNDTIKDKIRTSNIKSSNKKSFIDIEGLVSINESTFDINCKRCGRNYEIDKVLFYKRREYGIIICNKCNPLNSNYSSSEIEIIDYIKTLYNGVVLHSDRDVLDKKEIDIYLPELNIGIEYNGVYWHNELYKDKMYHKDKYIECLSNNVKLFSIYEDDWNKKRDVVKSMICNKIGTTPNRIFARKCDIKIVNNNEDIKSFLNDNHIQGYVSSSVKIGLYHCNEIVSLMTFKRGGIGCDWDLNRFCNRKFTNVIGGASKLFKFFTRNYQYESIKSFSCNDYSDGALYPKLGFIKDLELRPDYTYVVNGVRKHKSNFRKTKLDNILEDFDIGLSEHENMLNNSIYRIYDSGKIRWLFN